MSSVAFNMSASMEKALVGVGRDLCVVLGEKYGFDGGAAMLELGLSVTTGQAKKVGGKAVKKTPSSVRAQPSIPLPFTGTIREDCCIGVKQNHGLYTQCFSGASSAGENGLCKGCAKQASKNASGEPDCGLIAKRVMQGSEYRDSKGRAPVHYTKVMKKQKLSEEQVLGEAAKFGIEIDASHFAIPQAQQKRGRPKKATTSDTESENSSSAADATGEKKTRGRPKKAAKVVEVSETEDLFASLMQQAQSASPRPSASLVAGGGSAAADEMSDVSSDSESDSSESKGSKKKTKKSKEESEEALAEKAAKFLAKEQEKETKAAAKALAQQEKEAERALKLAEKEKAQQEKALKLAEKEKAQQEKALAQQKKALAQQEKEKAQQEKAKKLAEKPKKVEKVEKVEKTKKTKKAEEPAKPVEPVADLESEAESEDDTSEAEEPVVAVKKFEYQGVTYLKSGDGILYHAKSQEVVGKWNEKTQTIDVYDGGSDSDEDSDSDDE